MRIQALSFRKNDIDYIIYVDFVDLYAKTEWRISDIQYKEKRKRKYASLESEIRDSYDYRKLNMNERKRYFLSKCEEMVGKEKVAEAFREAWVSIMPDFDNIVGSL